MLKKMRLELESEKKRIIAITYICFAFSGMLALSTGSLLPFIRDSRGLSYGQSGMVVSLHAVGGIFSGFFAGVLAQKAGRKISILCFSIFFPIAYILIMTGGGVLSVSLAFLFLGLARGANSNYCNAVINELAPGRASALNGLHAMFSVGAFVFPLLLSIVTADSAGNWIYACLFMACAGVLSFILFAISPETGKKAAKDKTEPSGTEMNSWGFFRERLFYTSTATLFFYMCAEAGVTGWMVTYFTDTGYISDTLAQLAASILWIMIMAGRLTAAYLSAKIDKRRLLPVMGAGLVFFFVFLLFVKTPVPIVICIMGFGFFMAGIFPTTVSFTGELISRYPLSWSFILTVSSLGGVFMPSIVGYVAQKAGIVLGISTIAVAVVADLFCILSICGRVNRTGKPV